MTIDKEFWIVLIRVEAADDGRADPPACWRNVAGSTEKDHALQIARASLARGVAALVAKVELWEFPTVESDPRGAVDELADARVTQNDVMLPALIQIKPRAGRPS